MESTISNPKPTISKAPFRPLLDRVLLIPDPEKAEITKAGLYLPEWVGEKPKSGVVVACGEGKDNIKMNVKPGDSVLFGKHAGYEMKIKDTTYILIREPDIFAILNE